MSDASRLDIAVGKKVRRRCHQQFWSASEAYLAENHDARSRRQSVIFEEPPSGGFSRAIWLEYTNQQTFKEGESGEFPREVGLFLSYPPEDVKGFIDHRASGFKCAGLWKVYGDEEKARSLFAQYKKCTEIYCALWQSGSKLEQLAVAV